ncbi:MAG: competence/damage-inducible protein A [Planctomycetota bacterium]|jgi:nicotinamide-nucleotide amidase
MKVSVVSIGNELLNGQTVDTNASWLAGRLYEIGIETVSIHAVPDTVTDIVQVLIDVSAKADVILISGGLGPTEDDLTRQAVASFLNADLQLHPHIVDRLEAFFAVRGRKMADTNRRQAYMPQGCDILDNPCGTAPGFWGQKGGISVAVMPGVPSEMKQMFQHHVLPRIVKMSRGGVIASGKVRIFGPGESTLAQTLGDLMHRSRNPLINCTCGAGELLLHVVASADDQATAAQMVQADKDRLTKLLGQWVYGYDDDSLPLIVSKMLKQQGKTIALAESCTGGMLSSMLTDIPGASDYLHTNWVTYRNEAKVHQLGVPAELIATHGAVSDPVARAMAQGAAQKAGTHIGVGITGIAGPGGGTDDKPVGLVYIGICIDGKCTVEECRFLSINRNYIRQRSALTALNLIRSELCI